jgi:drug/metabolite transporter (DMT)-like permease
MPFVSVLLSVWLNITVDFIDKTISQRGTAQNLAFWTNVIQFFLILPLIGLVHPVAIESLGLCGMVGVLTAYGRIPWFRALAIQGQELSRLTPFVRLSSVFVLLGAIFILGEPFNPLKFLGGCLLILGAMLSLLDSRTISLGIFLVDNRAPLFAMLYAACNAAVPLLYKFLVDEGEDLLSIYFYLKFFQAVFIIASSAQGAISSLQTTTFDAFRLIVVARILQTSAALVYLYALTKLQLSIAEPIAALGPFFVLIVEAAHRRLGRPPGGGRSPGSLKARLVSSTLASLGLVLLVYHR